MHADASRRFSFEKQPHPCLNACMQSWWIGCFRIPSLSTAFFMYRQGYPCTWSSLTDSHKGFQRRSYPFGEACYTILYIPMYMTPIPRLRACRLPMWVPNKKCGSLSHSASVIFIFAYHSNPFGREQRNLTAP